MEETAAAAAAEGITVEEFTTRAVVVYLHSVADQCKTMAAELLAAEAQLQSIEIISLVTKQTIPKFSEKNNTTTRVKAKTTMKRTPLPDQRMATTKRPAKPRKYTQSAASRRIIDICKQTIISRVRVQFKKDANKKIKSSYTTVESLGKESSKGGDLAWIEPPEPETFLYQDEKTLEYYNYYRNYYAPLQELKKTKNMTWNAIQAIHVEHFPDKHVPKSRNGLSARAYSCYHGLCVVIEAEKEAVALAEATQNPEFVFPNDDDDDDDEYNGRALDGQAK
ncbi:uncharacterized protein Bfra_010610 [Botrytis fragariae]|uniref:Uncharacterized protein n=1 Tax=Botrytis fragariae TaxID=1964551 RepID=A0A8H6AI01_9HELO|nr:uncharacterized protein Bfra_010610 [Botrytis fragariae]KAF5867635.1 hypothetical protein Bfra_010610 [Botrytis fragariae]